jgi:predicted aspartyl protease
MGLTKVSTTISNIQYPKKKATDIFLVDTGSGYTVLPYEIAKKLKIEPVREQDFTLADGTIMTRKIGFALIELDLTKQKYGVQRAPATVVIGEKGDNALLGAVTLENMGLIVDPFKRELRPMKLML